MGRAWTAQPSYLCRPLALTGRTVSDQLAEARAVAVAEVAAEGSPFGRPWNWQIDDPEIALDVDAGVECYVAADSTGVTRRLRVVTK